MTELLPALAAALIAGLLGSAHCIGMCAGISGLFAAHASIRSFGSQLPLAIAYNTGRLLSYSLLGALIAFSGNRIVSLIPALATPVRFLAGLLIVLIGLQIAFGWRLLLPLERMGGTVWARVSPFASALLPVTGPGAALGLGLLWGLLPCGLVYSVLLLAAAGNSPLDGGLIMLTFGIATTPAMLMTGLGAARLSHIANRRGARRGLGLLVAVLGLATVAMPISSLTGASHHGHHEHAHHDHGHHKSVP